MEITIATTTINVPRGLVDYARMSTESTFLDGKDKLEFVIAGDKKTPDLHQFAKELEREYGVAVKYLDLDAQRKLDADFYDYMPLNSVSRRTFAMLYAYRSKSDVTIMVDDDNLIRGPSYYEQHSIVGKERNVKEVSSSSGWFNVCRLLDESMDRKIFHRGFPIDERIKEDKATFTERSLKRKVVLNEGLWVGAPDIDAVTWLAHGRLETTGLKQHDGPIALNNGTWSPINSQNTAIATYALPAFFLFPFIGRYDDIWAGYVFRKISDALGDTVTYGEPIVEQKRNPHDYLQDLSNEVEGMAQTPELIRQLRGMTLDERTYDGCASELVDKLETTPMAPKVAELKEGYTAWLSAIYG